MLRLAQRALGPAGAALPNGARFLGARHTLSQGMDALAVAGLPDLNAASSSMLPRKSALASGPMLSASPVCASVAASSLVSAAATAAAAAGASSLAVCVAASAPAGARRTFAAPSDKRGANNKEGNPNDLAFTMEGVTKRLDQGRVLFSNITTGFFHGAKIGIIGKNGAGKSTLLKIIAGVDKTFDGAAKPGVGKKVGYLSQEPSLDDTKNVLDNVLLGVAEHKAVLDEYEAVNKKFEDPEADIDQLVERQGQLQTIIDEKNLWDLMRFVDVAMVALRCPPADAMATSLSGGERRRVALCRLLISQPDILLLDEPTNHLDAGSVAWLEQFLAQYSGLVIAITHDRYFLDNVAGYILEIESGRFLPFKGNYAQWLDAKARRVEQEAKDKKALDRVLSRELEWMSRNANGRQAKSKARIAKIEELQKQKANMYKSRVESGSLVIPAGPRLGKKAIAVNNLGLAFDESRGPGGVFSPKELVERKAQGLPEPPWLFRNVNFTVEGGQIVGIVGPNGVGKTTLLKVIQQMMEPSAGNVTIGETVAFGYNAQSRAALRDGALVWQEITDGEEWVQLDPNTRISARKYVAQFNFSSQDQSKTIGQLSGGERNRAQLAKSLRRGANVILLDEPTNDLDVDTLRSLEEALQSFEGIAFIVSHDRWFLDRVCTNILGFEEVASGEKRPGAPEKTMTATLHQGNYTEFIEAMKEKTGRDYVVGAGKRFKNVTVMES